MQLLLVDNRVKDVETVTQSLLPSVDYVLIDFETDTYETLVAKIPVKTYDSVGIFQENYDLNTYQLVSSFTNSVLTGVKTEDPTLETWSQYKSLLSYFKDTLQVKTLDLMGCNIHSSPDWNYVIDYLGKQFQISINSSNDNTGSPDFGGNWILEAGNQDLIGKYFSNNIDKYQFILGNQSSHTVILKNDGTVWSCGLNTNGQLGDGTTTSRSYPVQVLSSAGVPLINVVQVAYGSSHTVFLKNDGTVYTVGLNSAGQLGDGTTTSKSYPVQVLASAGVPLSNVVQVACGTSFTVFLLSNGSVFTVGLNTNGQLGDGTTTSKSYPVQVLASAGVPLSNVVQVACGASFTVFLLSNGSVFTVGLNTNGQLGDGTTTQRLFPVQVLASVGVPLSNIAQVACGSSFTVFLLSNGSVFTVGLNTNGQLGDGTTTQRSYPVIVKTSATNNPALSGVVQVACGTSFTVFLLSNGSVFTVGLNTNGQLGDGTTTQRLFPVQVKIDATANNFLTGVSQVTCGASHTIFLKNDGSVFTVGLNTNGRLGDGTTTQRLYPVQVLASAGNGLIGGYLIGSYLIREYNSYYYKNKSTITNSILASLTYSLLDYLMIGLTPTQLQTSPYNYTQSNFYNQSVVNFLITNGYYTAAQMFNGGVTIQQMFNGGVTIQQMFNGSITVIQMLNGGITVQQMFNGGISVQQMLSGGITVQQMYTSFIYETTNTLTYDTAVTSTTLATNIDTGIYNIDLTGKNFKYYNLVTNSYIGYNTLCITSNGLLAFTSISSDLNGTFVQLPINTLRFFSFDAQSTIKYYFDTNGNLFISTVGSYYNNSSNLAFTIVIKVTPVGLIQVYYQSIGTGTIKPIIGWVGNNSSVSTDDIFYSTFNGTNAFVQSNINGKFLNFDFTTEIINYGSITPAQMYTGGVTPAQMYAGGITIQQMYTGGVSTAQMYAGGITIQQMYTGGISTAQIYNGGVSVQQMLSGGITIQQMYTEGVTLGQMLAGGITVQQMLAAGITIQQMYTGGVTLGQMGAGGITIQQMITGGITIQQILSYNIYESTNTLTYNTAVTSTTLATNTDSGIYNIDLTGKNFKYYNLATTSYTSYNTLCISTDGWLGFISSITDGYYGGNVQLPINTLRYFSFDAKSTINYYFDSNGNLFISTVGSEWNNSSNLAFTIVIKVTPVGLIQVYYQSIVTGTSAFKPIIGWVGNNSSVSTDDIFYSTFNGVNSFVQSNINGKFLNFDFTGLNVYMTANTPLDNIYTYTSTYGYTIKFITDIGSVNVNYKPPLPPPTITNVVTLDGFTSISFTQNPSDPRIKNYAYSTTNVIMNNNNATLAPFSSYTLLTPAQFGSPLTISGLNGVVDVKIKAVYDTSSYTDESNSVSNWYDYPGSMICFKEDTQILTSNGYVPIQNLKKGDLVETFKHGLKSITVIAKEEIFHTASATRMADQLYKSSQSEYSELFADLIITGRHSILLDEVDSNCINKKEYDGKYKLQSYKDSKFTVYEPKGKYMIYNFALQSDDDNIYYGVYANGMLVECCGEKCLQEQQSMTLI